MKHIVDFYVHNKLRIAQAQVRRSHRLYAEIIKTWLVPKDILEKRRNGIVPMEITAKRKLKTSARRLNRHKPLVTQEFVHYVDYC